MNKKYLVCDNFHLPSTYGPFNSLVEAEEIIHSLTEEKAYNAWYSVNHNPLIKDEWTLEEFVKDFNGNATMLVELSYSFCIAEV